MYKKIDNTYYCDTEFVNKSQSKLPGSELIHLWMGNFLLRSPTGDIYFDRTNLKIDGFVGRVHRMNSPEGHHVVQDLTRRMEYYTNFQDYCIQFYSTESGVYKIAQDDLIKKVAQDYMKENPSAPLDSVDRENVRRILELY